MRENHTLVNTSLQNQVLNSNSNMKIVTLVILEYFRSNIIRSTENKTPDDSHNTIILMKMMMIHL